MCPRTIQLKAFTKIPTILRQLKSVKTLSHCSEYTHVLLYGYLGTEADTLAGLNRTRRFIAANDLLAVLQQDSSSMAPSGALAGTPRKGDKCAHWAFRCGGVSAWVFGSRRCNHVLCSGPEFGEYLIQTVEPYAYDNTPWIQTPLGLTVLITGCILGFLLFLLIILLLCACCREDKTHQRSENFSLFQVLCTMSNIWATTP